MLWIFNCLMKNTLMLLFLYTSILSKQTNKQREFNSILWRFIKNYYFGSVEFNDEIINSETFKNLQISYLISKIIIITKYFIISFFKYPIWIFNLLALVLSLYFFRNIKILRVFLIFFTLNFLFIFLIYLTKTADIIWYLSASLDRLLLQTSGFYFVIFSLLNKRIIKF